MANGEYNGRITCRNGGSRRPTNHFLIVDVELEWLSVVVRPRETYVQKFRDKQENTLMEMESVSRDWLRKLGRERSCGQEASTVGT